MGAQLIAWLQFLPAELALEASLPAKHDADQGRWYEIDCLMAAYIVAEIGVMTAIWTFRRLHGG